MPFRAVVRRPIALLLLLASAAQADIVHLRDGTRHQGTILREDDRHVLIRLEPVSERGGVAIRVARRDILRIERAPASAPASTSAPARRDARAWSPEQLEQIWREALELLDDADGSAATRALQRLVLAADERQLAELSARTAELRGVELDELLATVRLRSAMSARGDEAFDLPYVTPFEAPAMCLLLERTERERLGVLRLGRPLSAWIGFECEITSLTLECVPLVRDARVAAAAIAARLRHDARLAGQSAARGEAIRRRDGLVKLAAHVRALPGFTALGEAQRRSGEDATGFDYAFRRLAATSRPASSSAPSREGEP